MIQPFLNDLTWSIAGKETDERARPGPAVHPYRQVLGRLSGLDKPKEQVCRVVAGNIDPAGILLLRIKCCLAGADWLLVRYCDVFAAWRAHYCEIERFRILIDKLKSAGYCWEQRQRKVYEHDAAGMLRVNEVSDPSHALSLPTI